MKVEKGIVITIIRSKGFGYIENKEGKEIFFHADGVCNPSFEELKEGHHVEYMVRKTPKGTKAIGVSVI